MRSYTLLLVAAAAGLAACSTDSGDGGYEPTEPFGRVRLVNAVPDVATVGPINAVIEGVPFTAGLAFGTGTPYQTVYTGSRELRVRRTADTAAVVFDAPLDVQSGQAYSVYATGRTGAVAALTVADSIVAAATDSARVRVVHVAPGAASVDVYLTTTAAAIAALAPSVASVAFRSASAYRNVPAGAYRVRVTAPGSKAVLADTSLAGAAAVALGSIRTVLVVDRVGGGGPPLVRVLTDR